MIELTLPWPPSVNSYKRVGRTVTTKTGKKYQQRVNSPETMKYYYQVAMTVGRKCPKIYRDSTISLEVVLDMHPPDNRRSDIDNFIKVTLDSLQRAGIIANDYQIARLVVERKDKIEGGQIIVRISPYVTL